MSSPRIGLKKLLLFTMLVAVLSAFGAAAAQAGRDKVSVCHLPPGNPFNWHTIGVPDHLVETHLNHGDLEGSCRENCETLCDDGDACTQDIASDPDECVCRAFPRPPVDCNDSNPCSADSCDALEGCLYDLEILDGTACDDGDPDTSNDQCTGGVCAGGLTGCAAGDRYEDQGDGTVLDCATQLLWLKDANCITARPWLNAESAVANLADGQCDLTDGSVAGDWRQPEGVEFCSLAGPVGTFGICDPASAPDSLIDSSLSGVPKVVNTAGTGQWSPGDPFLNVQIPTFNGSPGHYWTATANSIFTVIQVIGLDDGNVSIGFSPSESYSVWPVRFKQ